MYEFTIKALEKVFQCCNEEILQGQAPMPKFVIWKNTKYHPTSFFITAKGYKVVFREDTIHRDIYEIITEMVHNLVHIYHAEMRIDDTQKRCASHHKEVFAYRAAEFGLITQPVSMIGPVVKGMQTEVYRRILERIQDTALVKKALEIDELQQEIQRSLQYNEAVKGRVQKGLWRAL